MLSAIKMMLEIPDGIPFRLMDYLKLVDWALCQTWADKRGHIDSQVPEILNRLGLDAALLIKSVT